MDLIKWIIKMIGLSIVFILILMFIGLMARYSGFHGMPIGG